MTKTKDQILEEMREAMPFHLPERIRPYIEEAMEIYTNQQLHQCNVRCQLAISALEAIDNPVAYIKSNMEEGDTLNGMAVIMITEKPAFYQNIAKEALNKIANCI